MWMVNGGRFPIYDALSILGIKGRTGIEDRQFIHRRSKHRLAMHLDLYDQLLLLKPGPVVAMNRCVALAVAMAKEGGGPEVLLHRHHVSAIADPGMMRLGSQSALPTAIIARRTSFRASGLWRAELSNLIRRQTRMARDQGHLRHHFPANSICVISGSNCPHLSQPTAIKTLNPVPFETDNLLTASALLKGALAGATAEGFR